VPTDDVVDSEQENEYNKEIANDRNEFNLNTQSKEHLHSNLESVHLIDNWLTDKVVYVSLESDCDCEEEIATNTST
jgi:hypothetical protein